MKKLYTTLSKEFILMHKNWYNVAHEFCRKFENQEFSKVVGVCAALSVQKGWKQNKDLVRQYFSTGNAGHTQIIVEKCHKIMESDGSDGQILDILNGEKIKAFYLNIKYPDQLTTVTIDRHAAKIAGEYRRLTPKRIENVKKLYLDFAEKTDLLPHQLQAVLWVKHRRNLGLEKAYG